MKILNTFKVIILAAVLFVASFGAYASSACNGVYTLAKAIQEARQVGLPLTESLEIADRVKAENPALSHSIKMMVLRAYEEPRLNSKEFQQIIIQEFANSEQLACMKSGA